MEIVTNYRIKTRSNFCLYGGEPSTLVRFSAYKKNESNYAYCCTIFFLHRTGEFKYCSHQNSMPPGRKLFLKVAESLQTIGGLYEKKFTTYLHSYKEQNYEIGHELGIEGEALRMFLHALYEVEFECEVDMETGVVTIIKVNGKKLNETT